MTENRLPYFSDYDVRDVTAHSVGWGHAGKDELAGLTHPYGLRYGYDSFRSKVFARPLEPGENPFPTHASMRAERRFQGTRLAVPLEYLEAVDLPVDYPTTQEADRQDVIEQRCRFGLPPVINVFLPVSGAPVIARRDMPQLAAARALELFEVIVRVTYV